MIECPKCHAPNDNRRRVCQNCSEQLQPDHASALVPKCNYCHSEDPNVRMLHWMGHDHGELLAHLKMEFPKHYAEFTISSVMAMKANRAARDARGPGAFANQSRDSQRAQFEAFHVEHCAKHGLFKRHNESSRAFATRCLQAANAGKLYRPLAAMLPREPGCDDEAHP